MFVDSYPHMMRLIYITCLMLGLTLISCQDQRSQKVKPPANLLSEEQMTDILRDLHIIDAGIIRVKMPITERDNRRAKLYDLLMEHNKIDKQLFYDSYEYYLTQPYVIDSIYSRIIDDINHIVPEEQKRMKARKDKDRKDEEMDFENLPKPIHKKGKSKMGK